MYEHGAGLKPLQYSSYPSLQKSLSSFSSWDSFVKEKQLYGGYLYLNNHYRLRSLNTVH